MQAIARAHRIGQTKVVNVYRLVCQDTVEDQMMTRIRKKLYLSTKVTDNMKDIYAEDESNEVGIGAAEDVSTTLGSADLIRLLRGGAGAIVKWNDDQESATFAHWRSTSITDIIKKSEATTMTRDQKSGIQGEVVTVDAKTLAETEEEERALLAGMERVQTTLFEGKSHAKSNAQAAEGNS